MSKVLYIDDNGNISETVITTGGGSSMSVVQVSNDTTLTVNTFVLANASAKALTLTLPSGSDNDSIVVKKVDSTANTVKVIPNSGQTVESDDGVIIENQNTAIELTLFNNNWNIS